MQIGTTVCHCFGCGFSGNALTFLEELEGLSVDESIKWLGERWDVSRKINFTDFRNVIQKKLDRIEKRINKTIEYKSYEISILDPGELLDRAIDWEAVWLQHKISKHNHDAYYLLDRGFSWQILDKWCIGWDEKSYRFTIPYFDANGNLIGFKGRGLPDRIPKYHVLGGSDYGFETVNISDVLFGLSYYQPSNDKTMIVCEGELNCISLHQDGFTNTVGISGRYISDRQAELIKSHCDSAILIFDELDDALDASKKLSDSIKVFIVPEHGKDPADMTYSEKEILVANKKSDVWYNINTRLR